MQTTMTGGLRQNLYKEIIQVIESGVVMDDAQFNDLALRLFRYQLSANSIYRGFFDAGRYPRPDHWKQIPALPAAAFKRSQIRAFPPDATVSYFQTSGTTEAEAGRHYFETLEIYEAAILPTFKQFLLPDKDRMRMEVLTPPPSEMPHSSLVHMMQIVQNNYGLSPSNYHMSNNAINLESLARSLESAVATQQPVMILGTAFAFVYTLEEMALHKVRFNLPFGSRIMETGGFKGRVHEVPRAQFYQALSEAFSIPQFNIVNEYGMTELSSQFYDISLKEQKATDHKLGSPWSRILIIDPETEQEQPSGKHGLIRIMDLANAGSVIALQTEDVGVAYNDGTFQVLGRVGRAPLRGCSMSVENLLN